MVDIDTDSDNSGVIDGTVEEDEMEMTAPGNAVLLNNDDDNENQVVDFLENPVGAADNDLELVEIRKLGPAGVDLTGYTYHITSSDIGILKLWKDPHKFGIEVVVAWIMARSMMTPWCWI